MLQQRTILLGVTGGIAAYKAVDLASRMTQAGATIRTVMTANAGELIRPKSFEAVTGQPVFTDLWSNSQAHQIEHVHLVDWADHIVVMERHHEEKIRRKFADKSDTLKIHSLGIPDIYYFMDPALVALVKEKFERVYDSEIKGKTD